MPFSVIVRQTVWGHQIRWASAGNISVDPTDPDNVTIVFADRGTPNPNATPGCFHALPGEAPDYDPCDAGPGSDTDVYTSRLDRRRGDVVGTDAARRGRSGTQWFPWGGYTSDGSLVVAWDEDINAADDGRADTLPARAVVDEEPASRSSGPREQIDISVTHWAGQYTTDVAGGLRPGGIHRPAMVADAEGKDCNVFHGDYTGLAVGPDDSDPRRVDGPQRTGDLAADRLLHGRPARRVSRRTRCTRRSPPPDVERAISSPRNPTLIARELRPAVPASVRTGQGLPLSRTLDSASPENPLRQNLRSSGAKSLQGSRSRARCSRHDSLAGPTGIGGSSRSGPW